MKIIMGIASTTHIDNNNDKMTKNALDGMAQQIQKKIIPLLIEHDWERQIGVVLYGEVFKMDDGEYGLGTISVMFESDEEKEIFKAGELNTNWLTYQNYFDVEEMRSVNQGDQIQLQIKENFNQNNDDELDDIANLLEEYFSENHIVREDGRVREIKSHVAFHKGMEIVIHSNDHTPPHFHVKSIQRGFNVRFYLETLELMSVKFGDISRNEIKAVQKFFTTNPKQLQKLRDKYKKLFPDYQATGS